VKLRCPNCHELAGAYILYGLPYRNEELFEKVEKKEIVLGGCIISYETHECTSCNYRWRAEIPEDKG